MFPFGGHMARRVGVTSVTHVPVREADTTTHRAALASFYDRMPGLSMLLERVIAVADAASRDRVVAAAQQIAAKPKRTWAHSRLRRQPATDSGQN